MLVLVARGAETLEAVAGSLATQVLAIAADVAHDAETIVQAAMARFGRGDVLGRAGHSKICMIPVIVGTFPFG